MPKHSSIKQKLVFHKIHFTIRKKVKFGEAVYVCGSTPQFGLWNPQRAFRLKWNEGNVWTGIILLTSNIPQSIEYKYVIASWDNPSTRNCQWQLGDHNRRSSLNQSKSITICDDKWNLDHIFLILLNKKSKSRQDQRFYVTGDICELGQWQQKKTMKKTVNNIISYQIRNHQLAIPQNLNRDYELWTYSFQIYRNKTQFYYYYIKKGEILESQRKPGRIYEFNNSEKSYPNRRKVINARGNIIILDEINIDQINISKITSQIYVGSYLKSASDLQKLKQNHITSILSIQSEKDFTRNNISPHFLQVLCQENHIKYKKYSIEDMNNKDFISKAEGGLKIMEGMLRSGQTVYVHCSAGIYRSPQMIALYLITFRNYKVEQAITLLKEKHPYAKPSEKVIEQALSLIESKKYIKIRG